MPRDLRSRNRFGSFMFGIHQARRICRASGFVIIFQQKSGLKIHAMNQQEKQRNPQRAPRVLPVNHEQESRQIYLDFIARCLLDENSGCR
jgi:hypothetical protein